MAQNHSVENSQSNPSFRVYDINKSKVKGAGDISSAFSTFGNSVIKGLPEVYAQIKKDLVCNPEELTASWLRLKSSLREEIKEIKELGHNGIPSVEIFDLQNLSENDRKKILKRGAFLIKNVIPKEEAKALKAGVLDYVKRNPCTTGFPKEDPVVFELNWSKEQLNARSHPSLRRATNFANKLWHASSDSKVCLDQNISYADRLSIRNPGDTLFSLGPHADGGSLERWEDPEYSKCYEPIFEGRWEDHEPYDATHRIGANMNLHESIGNCSIFRTFRAFLSLSETEPIKEE